MFNFPPVTDVVVDLLTALRDGKVTRRSATTFYTLTNDRFTGRFIRASVSADPDGGFFLTYRFKNGVGNGVEMEYFLTAHSTAESVEEINSFNTECLSYEGKFKL